MVDVFDKKKEFKSEVLPVIEKLYEKCSDLKLPMFVAVCVANNEKKTSYEYETLLAALQLDLKDNQIAKMLFSFNGFELDIPKDVKSALYTIQRYLERIDHKKVLNLNLKEDQINDFVRIVNGAEVNIPAKLMGKQLTLDDEFFDES